MTAAANQRVWRQEGRRVLEAQLRTQEALLTGGLHKVSQLGPCPTGMQWEDTHKQANLPRPDLLSWKGNPVHTLCFWFILKPNKVSRLLLPLFFAFSLRGGSPHQLDKEHSLVHIGSSVSPVHQGAHNSHKVCVWTLHIACFIYLSCLLAPSGFDPPELNIQRSEWPQSGRQSPRCHLSSSSSFLKGQRQSLKTFPAP